MCHNMFQPDYIKDAIEAVKTDTMNRAVQLNVEYRIASLPHVTLVDECTGQDIIESLVKDGLLLVDSSRRDKRVQKLVSWGFTLARQTVVLNNDSTMTLRINYKLEHHIIQLFSNIP